MDLNFRFDAILEEIAIQAALETARRENSKLEIPVTMRGVMVGMGTLYADGSFAASINESPEGQELRKKLLEGSANCISVGPNPISPQPRHLHE